jgi:hypothetical protein
LTAAAISTVRRAPVRRHPVVEERRKTAPPSATRPMILHEKRAEKSVREQKEWEEPSTHSMPFDHKVKPRMEARILK